MFFYVVSTIHAEFFSLLRICSRSLCFLYYNTPELIGQKPRYATEVNVICRNYFFAVDFFSRTLKDGDISEKSI